MTVVTLKGEDEGHWGRSKVHRSSLHVGDPVRRNLWRETRLPALLRKLRADVLLVPAPEGLRRSTVPQVLLIHDLGPLMAPAVYGRARYARYLSTLGSSCRHAEQLVCVSRSTELDLLRWTPAALGKTRVAHNALQVRARLDEPASTPSSGREGGYTLYVGAALPHKNLDVLLEAYRHPIPGMPSRLVLAGPDYAGEVARLMSRIPPGASITHRGFVPVDTLHDLYRKATVFAMPSVFEGFGIPVLEAMSFGVPVVASDIPGLREAGGSAAVYVPEPMSPRAWRQALAQVATADAGGARNSEGIARAKGFSWERMAGTVRSALEDAMVGPPCP